MLLALCACVHISRAQAAVGTALLHGNRCLAHGTACRRLCEPAHQPQHRRSNQMISLASEVRPLRKARFRRRWQQWKRKRWVRRDGFHGWACWQGLRSCIRAVFHWRLRTLRYGQRMLQTLQEADRWVVGRLEQGHGKFSIRKREQFVAGNTYPCQRGTARRHAGISAPALGEKRKRSRSAAWCVSAPRPGLRWQRLLLAAPR